MLPKTVNHSYQDWKKNYLITQVGLSTPSKFLPFVSRETVHNTQKGVAFQTKKSTISKSKLAKNP